MCQWLQRFRHISITGLPIGGDNDTSLQNIFEYKYVTYRRSNHQDKYTNILRELYVMINEHNIKITPSVHLLLECLP